METITESHNYSQCRGQLNVEAPATADRYIYSTTYLRLREHRGRVAGETIRARGPGSLLEDVVF